MIRSRAARELLLAAIASLTSERAAHLRARLLHTECYIDTGVLITDPEFFFAGERSALYHGTHILNGPGTVRLGSDSHLGAFCHVNARRGVVRIGDNVAIGPGCKLMAHSNHYERGRLVTQTRITADVVIGDNVFVGANCVILPGATIGNDVVIGAGALVKGTIGDGGVYGGVPARPIRATW